jgi:HK97 gp10 family phage protein
MSNRITGLKELTAKLRSIKGIRPQVVRPGADVAVHYAKKNAPVDTGYLRDSGFSRDADYGADIVFGAPYSAYVEMGTSRAPAQPYVRPAIDEHEGEIVDAIAEEAWREIERLAR